MELGRVRVRMDSCACRARHVAERLMCRHMRSAARLRDRRPAAGSWCCCLHRPAARWYCCLHRSQKPSPLRRPRRRARRRRCEQALPRSERAPRAWTYPRQKIESARRLVWRVADQRIALLPAMHIDEWPEVGARGWRGRPSSPHAQRLMAASGESPPELTSAPRCLAAHMLAPRYAPRCLAAHMLAPRYL
jgi:hypothetical protein